MVLVSGLQLRGEVEEGGGIVGKLGDEALLVREGDECFGGMIVKFWIRFVSEIVDCTVAVSDILSGTVEVVDKVWVSCSISIVMDSELVVAAFLCSLEEVVMERDLCSLR